MPSREEATVLTEADVAHVARLARLHLDPEEVPRMTAELSAIVTYVQKLSELDTTGVPPTSQVEVERAPLRADAAHQSLDHDAALSEAPRAAHDGFAVPGYVEE